MIFFVLICYFRKIWFVNKQYCVRSDGYGAQASLKKFILNEFKSKNLTWNPSEEIKLAAVNQNGNAIKYIKSPVNDSLLNLPTIEDLDNIVYKNIFQNNDN